MGPPTRRTPGTTPGSVQDHHLTDQVGHEATSRTLPAGVTSHMRAVALLAQVVHDDARADVLDRLDLACRALEHGRFAAAAHELRAAAVRLDAVEDEMTLAGARLAEPTLGALGRASVGAAA